jgi:hypothetical protein
MDPDSSKSRCVVHRVAIVRPLNSAILHLLSIVIHSYKSNLMPDVILLQAMSFIHLLSF